MLVVVVAGIIVAALVVVVILVLVLTLIAMHITTGHVCHSATSCYPPVAIDQQ